MSGTRTRSRLLRRGLSMKINHSIQYLPSILRIAPPPIKNWVFYKPNRIVVEQAIAQLGDWLHINR